MRTIVKEEIIYSWEDVKNNPEFLEKVLDKNRDINTDMGIDWWDFVYDDCIEKLKSLGYYNIDIRFSGFYSQGDGASFTGNVDVLEWIRINDKEGKYKRISKLVNDGVVDIQNNKIVRDRWSNHVHWNTTTFHFYTNYQYGACQNYNNIESILKDLEYDIHKHHVDLNKEIYRSLEDTHDYLQSDQSVCDTLEANDYEFDEQGNII
jgi:hypothetical protein